MDQDHLKKQLLDKLENFILSNLEENKEKTFTASEDLYLWLCNQKYKDQTLTKISNDIQIKIPYRTIQQIKYKIQTLNLLTFENVQLILNFFQSTQQDPNQYKIGFDKYKNFKQLSDFSGKKKVNLSAYQNNDQQKDFYQNKQKSKNKSVLKDQQNDINEINQRFSQSFNRNQNFSNQNENQCNDSIQTISKVELSQTKKKALNHALNYMLNNVNDLDDSIILKINELNNYAINDAEKVYQKCLQYNRMMHEIKNKQRIQIEVDIIKQKCEYMNNEKQKFKIENTEPKRTQFCHEDSNIKKYIRID